MSAVYRTVNCYFDMQSDAERKASEGRGCVEHLCRGGRPVIGGEGARVSNAFHFAGWLSWQRTSWHTLPLNTSAAIRNVKHIV